MYLWVRGYGPYITITRNFPWVSHIVFAWVGGIEYNMGMNFGDYRMRTITAATTYYHCHSCGSVTKEPNPHYKPKEGCIMDSKYTGRYYVCASCHKQALKHEAAHYEAVH